jgi:hypothetical protein
MALSDAEWAAAQSWIGTAEQRSTFEARYDRLDSDLDAAIREALLSLVTVTASQPGSISLPSGLSISVGENIRTWREVLAMFLRQGGTDAVPEADTGTKFYKRVRPQSR